MLPKTILLFGAGKSATALIDYLLKEGTHAHWRLIVVDAHLDLAREKLAGAPNAEAVSFDISNAALRHQYIQNAAIVISLLPPALHILVARDCLHYSKNLLTASYIDAELQALAPAIAQKGLLFLCEMGLDPGIDHMSARQIFQNIENNGGRITSFLSHCGGLVAPESDDNAWHYKISWNPRNVVLAGKAGAVFKEKGLETALSYTALFNENRVAAIDGLAPLSWYPNRNSLPYIKLYGLPHCHTFIRTTLRHPEFMKGWKKVIDLKLTDETQKIQVGGKSIQELYALHFKNQQIQNPMLKPEAVDASTLTQLSCLGLHDTETTLAATECTAADLLQAGLEKNLALNKHDKDMVVMQHEIEYECNAKAYKTTSTLIVKGIDNQHTAMAKTVGLPLGIAVKLILNETITTKGLQLPLDANIYEPVLRELAAKGISFTEKTTQLQ